MKKLVAFVLTVTVILSTNIFGVISYAVDCIPAKNTISINQQTISFDPINSEELILNPPAEVDPKGPVLPLTIYSLSGYVCYDQINDYTCGPAALKAALDYINGSSPSVNELSIACGTNGYGSSWPNLLTCLNSYQNEHTYVSDMVYDKNSSETINAFITRVRNNFDINDVPVIYWMSPFNGNTTWPYTSSNPHCVSGFSYVVDNRYGNDCIGIADPWIGYASISFSSTYTVSFDDFWAAISFYLY